MSSHRHNHFKPLPRRTFYRLTPTLLMTHHHRSDSRMVIFLFITRTVWDRYLQVAFVKLDAINAAPTKVVLFYRGGAEAARGAHNPEVTRSRRVSGIFHFSHFIEMRMYRKYETVLPAWRRGSAQGS